jgi:hypothetical protein
MPRTNDVRVVLRACLVFAGRVHRRGAYLVGLQPVQQVILAIEHANMGTVELVLRGTIHITPLCSRPGLYSIARQSTNRYTLEFSAFVTAKLWLCPSHCGPHCPTDRRLHQSPETSNVDLQHQVNVRLTSRLAPPVDHSMAACVLLDPSATVIAKAPAENNPLRGGT